MVFPCFLRFRGPVFRSDIAICNIHLTEAKVGYLAGNSVYSVAFSRRSGRCHLWVVSRQACLRGTAVTYVFGSSAALSCVLHSFRCGPHSKFSLRNSFFTCTSGWPTPFSVVPYHDHAGSLCGHCLRWLRSTLNHRLVCCRTFASSCLTSQILLERCLLPHISLAGFHIVSCATHVYMRILLGNFRLV